jgi:hypothetical protein
LAIYRDKISQLIGLTNRYAPVDLAAILRTWVGLIFLVLSAKVPSLLVRRQNEIKKKNLNERKS